MSILDFSVSLTRKPKHAPRRRAKKKIMSYCHLDKDLLESRKFSANRLSPLSSLGNYLLGSIDAIGEVWPIRISQGF